MFLASYLAIANAMVDIKTPRLYLVINPTDKKLIFLKNIRIGIIYKLNAKETYFIFDIFNTFKALTLGAALEASYKLTSEISRNIINNGTMVIVNLTPFKTNAIVLAVNGKVIVTPE